MKLSYQNEFPKSFTELLKINSQDTAQVEIPVKFFDFTRSENYHLTLKIMWLGNRLMMKETRNPSIYNIIRWFAGPMRQTTCRPSV